MFNNAKRTTPDVVLHHAPKSIRSAVVRFLATPASPLPWGVLRIGLGVLLIGQAIVVAPHLLEFYGSLGLVQAPVVERMVRPFTPRLSWVSGALSLLGLDETAAIRLVFTCHLLNALAFLVGWRTRVAAVCLWMTNLIMTTSGSPYLYGFDTFANIALFYCMFAPVGSALSCDLIAGRASGTPSFAARLSLRVLQAHLALVYAASGIEKASGIQWWNGEALWRSWMRADLGTLDFSWIAWTPWIAAIGCWTTLGLEVGYALFMWPKRTRKWWGLAMIAMHAGISLTMGLHAFAGIMILLTVSAWMVPCDPRSPRAAGGMLHNHGLSRRTPQPVTEDAAPALPELEEAVAMAEKSLPPEHPHLNEYREMLAKCSAALAEQGKPVCRVEQIGVRRSGESLRRCRGAGK
jgi:hypothetical protein